MTPTQSPTMASQATAELPKLPEPYSVKSTIKCTACGAPYAPPMTLAGGAAQWPGGLLPPHACRCGNTQFGGTVSSESLSPAQFTADQMNANYLAGYEAGRASRAQSEPEGWQPSATTPQVLLDWLNRRRNESKPVCLIEPDDSVAQTWLDEFERLLDERKPDSYSRNRTNFTITINWESDCPRQTITVFQSAIKAVNARFEGVCYLAPATLGETK
jgi:hypothetical protein